MSVAKFVVVFDKPDLIYNAGEMVIGRVELVLNSAMNIRGVKLKLKGKAKCEWKESESDGCRKSTEIYLKCEQTLAGEKVTKLELSAGKYVYSFAEMLPLKAPSSYKSNYGEIVYYGKAKILIPFGFVHQQTRTRFTVNNPLNLNLYPHLRIPFNEEKNKTFCCLWCASGSLTMVVYLPQTAFAASESIPITLEIDNASKVAVYAIYIRLMRKISWTADGCHKNKETELQTLRIGGVREGQSLTLSEYFTIPPFLYPNLECCSIIKINHELHIESEVSGMHLNLDLQVPITIGDIPLNEDPNAPIVSCQAPVDMISAPPNSSTLHLHPKIEEMPGMSPNYPLNENPSSESAVLIQQSQSHVPTQGLPSLPVTNLECSQNVLHSPAVISEDTDVQSENSSSLNDGKDDGVEENNFT